MLEVALTVAAIFFSIYLIGKWKIFQIEGISVAVFKGLFIIKILAALALYFIYTQFYTDRAYADIFRYYDDSQIIFNTLFTHPWDYFRMLSGWDGNAPELSHYYDAMLNWYNTDLIFNDSRTMIRINAFLRLFSFGTYFPHAVVMCFLAMLGLTGIFRVANSLIKGKSLLFVVLIFLLPSTLLWTSGMIKEAFLVFALGALLYQIDESLKTQSFSFRRIIYIIFSMMILITVKAYVFFLILPVLMVWIFIHFGKMNSIFSATLFFAAYFFLLSASAPFITGKSVPELLAKKQAEFYFVADREQAKSVVEVTRLQPEWLSLIKAAPGSFLRTLLLPMPQHAHNILMWFSVAENLFILLLIAILLFSIDRSVVPKNLTMIFCFFVFGCAVFILSGWVTPIIGALVRYKVPGLPFFLFPLTAFSSRKWMSGTQWKWFHTTKS